MSTRRGQGSGVRGRGPAGNQQPTTRDQQPARSARVLPAGDCRSCGSMLGDHDARYCALCGKERCVRCAEQSDIRAEAGWRWYCSDCLDSLVEFDAANERDYGPPLRTDNGDDFIRSGGERLSELPIDREVPTWSPPEEAVRAANDSARADGSGR